ncbi:unnamed protein product [Discosporangium mesarthrocarpum]
MGSYTMEEYIRGYRGKVDELGAFPDKNIINSLTQSASRHPEMADGIVALLEGMIADPTLPHGRKLPLCYLVDSILKNVGNPYSSLFHRGVVRWFSSAYEAVDEKSKVSVG